VKQNLKRMLAKSKKKRGGIESAKVGKELWGGWAKVHAGKGFRRTSGSSTIGGETDRTIIAIKTRQATLWGEDLETIAEEGGNRGDLNNHRIPNEPPTSVGVVVGRLLVGNPSMIGEKG